jgi:hypothetical protein
MASTGTNNFTVTRDDVIKAALRVLNVIGVGETPEPEDYTNCSQALNIMIKSWAKKGFPLWVFQQIVLPTYLDVTVYPIGPTAGYLGSVTINDGGSGFANSGTFTCTGGTNGTDAEGTFTAVAGVLTTMTFTNGGDSYTGQPTFTFSSGTGEDVTANIVGLTMSRPLRIVEGYIRTSAGLDTNIMPISRQEYDMLGNKTTAGIINQFYYDEQLENGQLYVFNPQSVEGSSLYLLAQRQFYDMTNGTDNFDFPQEWFQALKWGLAEEVAMEYNIDLQVLSYYTQKAQMLLEECFNESVEEASVYFTFKDR